MFFSSQFFYGAIVTNLQKKMFEFATLCVIKNDGLDFLPSNSKINISNYDYRIIII